LRIPGSSRPPFRAIPGHPGGSEKPDRWGHPVGLAAGGWDADLEERLYGASGVKPGRRKLPEPDWSAVARELKRKHVTLQVLWEEHHAEHPDGYRYSRFCDLFRRWEGRLPLVMRQSHAGRREPVRLPCPATAGHWKTTFGAAGRSASPIPQAKSAPSSRQDIRA